MTPLQQRSRSQRRDRGGIVLVAIALVLGVLTATPAAAATSAMVNPQLPARIAGPDRIATAVAVANAGWTTSPVAVLARSDDPADALAGSTLAGSVHGPLLVTPSDQLDPRVLEQLRRLRTERVLLLGGPRALAPAVESALRVAGLQTERIAGATRYETAAAIAGRMGATSASLAFVVQDWPSALAVSGVAARRSTEGNPTPILLSGPTAHAAVLGTLRDLGIDRVVIAGTSSAATLAKGLAASGRAVEQVVAGGSEALAVAIAGRFPDEAGGPALLVTSAKFPDGLSAGALAGRLRGTMFLTNTERLAAPVREWLVEKSPVPSVTAIGGGLAIGDGVLRDAQAAIGVSSFGAPSPRISSFVTMDDLSMWRERSQDGPYRRRGDVSQYSPGEWDEVVDRANEFHANPAKWRWAGPVHNNPGGVVKKDYSGQSDPDLRHHTLIGGAAFEAAVTGDVTKQRIVAKALLAQVREPGVDFTNRSRWNVGIDDINPLFMTSNWVATLLLAVDHLEAVDPFIFTLAEQRELNAWFHGFGQILHGEIEHTYGRRWFADWAERSEPPFTPGPGWARFDDEPEYAHDGVGSTVTLLSRGPNNRRSQMARTLGMIGLRLSDAATEVLPPRAGARDGAIFLATTTKFFKSLIAYGTFAGGYTSEISRGDSGVGYSWSYSWAQLAPYATMAHLLAQRGDRELMDWTTRAGHQTTVLSSADPDKSFARSVRTVAAWTTGQGPTRYGDRIDGSNVSGGIGYHDIGTLAVFTLHNDDPVLEATMRRDASVGLDGHPKAWMTSFRTSHAVFGHDWHVFPASMFYFGAT